MDNYLEYTIKAGDTLQLIANDVMDDVSRWQEIAFVNRLRYPYISDEAEYGNIQGVRRTGDTLLLPVTVDRADLLPHSELVEMYQSTLGTDLGVFTGDTASIELTREGIAEFQAGPSGDLARVRGAENLKQALLLRLATPLGTLFGHPTYGSRISTIIGTRGTADNIHRLQVEVERTIRSDARIKNVPLIETELISDAVHMTIDIEPEDLDATLRLNLNISEAGDIRWV